MAGSAESVRRMRKDERMQMSGPLDGNEVGQVWRKTQLE